MRRVIKAMQYESGSSLAPAATGSWEKGHADVTFRLSPDEKAGKTKRRRYLLSPRSPAPSNGLHSARWSSLPAEPVTEKDTNVTDSWRILLLFFPAWNEIMCSWTPELTWRSSMLMGSYKRKRQKEFIKLSQQ